MTAPVELGAGEQLDGDGAHALASLARLRGRANSNPGAVFSRRGHPATDPAAVRPARVGRTAVPRARAHGVPGLGAAGLRHAARASTCSTRSRSRSTSAGGSSSAASRPGWAGCATIGRWWLAPVAFQKAILWSMLFEGLGLGCGSGPLTGRYFPPIGGFLYFLRPGHDQAAAVRRAAAPRRHRAAPGSTSRSTWRCVVVAAARAGRARARRRACCVADRGAGAAPRRARQDDLPRAARRALLDDDACASLFAGNWIAGAKAVQLALWFWAGVSKLNHHFPAVVCVMTSNSPFTRFAWLRRAHVPRLSRRPAPVAAGRWRWRTPAPRSSWRVPIVLAAVAGRLVADAWASC